MAARRWKMLSPFSNVPLTIRNDITTNATSESTSVPNDHSRILAKIERTIPLFRTEQVADAANGADQLPILHLQFLTQVAHVHIDGAFEGRSLPLIENRC